MEKEIDRVKQNKVELKEKEIEVFVQKDDKCLRKLLKKLAKNEKLLVKTLAEREEFEMKYNSIVKY